MKKIRRILASVIVAMVFVSLLATAQGGTYLSEEVREIVDKYAEEYGVSEYLIYAMIEKESAGQQYAVSKNGKCKGYMQINPSAHKSRMEKLGYTVDQVFEPEANIHTGIDYLMDIREESGIDDVAYCLDVYNGNSKAFSNYESGTISKYSRWLITRAMELTWFYEFEDKEL